MIFSKVELSGKIDFAVFMSLQGGHHNNVIAAVAVALKEANTPDFYEYIHNVKLNSKTLAENLIQLGYKLSTGGTENHLILIDLRNKGITGSKAEYILEKVNISVNKNAIVGDKKVHFSRWNKDWYVCYDNKRSYKRTMPYNSTI